MKIPEKIRGLKHKRAYLIEKLYNLNAVQFNKIPVGYTNNIIRNLGHMLVTPMHHLYPGPERGLPKITKKYEAYLKGTKPNTKMDSLELDQILNL